MKVLNLLQMHYHREGGQENHWEEAIAQHTHHTAHRYTSGAHQVQNQVHASAAHQPNTVNVTEMHLP